MQKTSSPRHSICMAVYNGERYLAAQIGSILIQLAADDELIIVDDCSTDGSAQVVKDFADPRVLYVRNEVNLGVVRTFEQALVRARGDVVFLADQDDLWTADKIEKIDAAFVDPAVQCVVSDCLIADADGTPTGDTVFAWRRSGPGFIKNVLRNGFHGCAMAMRRSVLDVALPFPENLYMHDSWLGLIASLLSPAGSKFIDDALVIYRRHSSTVTSGRRSDPAIMLARRGHLIMAILGRVPRILRHRISIH